MVKIGNKVLVNGVWVLDGCRKCMENCNKICEAAVKLAFDNNTFLSCDYFSIVSSYNFYKSARPLTFPMKCVEWHIMSENLCYCTNCKITYFPRECYANNNLELIGYSEKCPHCGGEPEYMKDIIYEHLYDCEEKDIFGNFIEDIDYSISDYLNYLDCMEHLERSFEEEDFPVDFAKDIDYSIEEHIDYLYWIEYFDHSFSEEDYPYIPAFHDPLYDKRCWAQSTKLCTAPDNCGNCCTYCKGCPDYKDCVKGYNDTL